MTFRAPNFRGRAADLNHWKSEKQQTLVLARLINAGHDVDSTTPPSTCWNLLTDLLVKEMGR